VTLDPLYKIIGYIIAFFYALPPHNLGLAIILMTVVVMLVQFPLIAKQTRSMIQMQRVQPEIKKIQQKYKDDRQKQNEELLKFYQENKINPLAGCLPLLIIFPIGAAVFRSFQQGSEVINRGTPQQAVRHASRGIQGHIPQSSQLYHDICGKGMSVAQCTVKLHTQKTPRAFYFLGMNLTWSAREVSSKLSGHFIEWLPYYLLIAIVIFTGWYQMRQTQTRQSKSGAPAPPSQMQAINRILPVFFGVIAFTLNAATTLYFIVSNIWRIGQTHFVLNKMYEEAHTPVKPASSSGGSGGDASGNGGGGSGGKAPPGGGKTAGGKPNSDAGGSRSSAASGAGNGSGGGSQPNRPTSGAARRKKKRKR
jgi:YidC/Oxa1 family membrane protein insertase